MSETMADILEEEDMDVGIGKEEAAGSDQSAQAQQVTEVQESSTGIIDVLTSKSPNKDLEEYRDDPLDFDGNESTWRILRGLEGLLGELSYALVDIVIGSYQKLDEIGGGRGRDDGIDQGFQDVEGELDAGNP